MTDKINTEVFGARTRLKELRIAHRELDTAIMALACDPDADQLQVRRLKKARLRLKDLITRIESALIPDLEA